MYDVFLSLLLILDVSLGGDDSFVENPAQEEKVSGKNSSKDASISMSSSSSHHSKSESKSNAKPESAF